LGVWGVVLVVCVCVGVRGVVLCRCLCVCDLLIFLQATPHRGELVVFRAPAAFFRSRGGEETSGTTLIKRVVAVAGDAVEMKKGVLYLNDKPRYAKR